MKSLVSNNENPSAFLGCNHISFKILMNIRCKEFFNFNFSNA